MGCAFSMVAPSSEVPPGTGAATPMLRRSRQPGTRPPAPGKHAVLGGSTSAVSRYPDDAGRLWPRPQTPACVAYHRSDGGTMPNYHGHRFTIMTMISADHARAVV